MKTLTDAQVQSRDRIELALRDAGFDLDESFLIAEAWNTRTPAIDTSAIREVIAELKDAPLAPGLYEIRGYADKLSRAIGDV